MGLPMHEAMLWRLWVELNKMPTLYFMDVTWTTKGFSFSTLTLALAFIVYIFKKFFTWLNIRGGKIFKDLH